LKKFIFTIAIVMVLTSGCIPVAPIVVEVPNEPPTAYIDSISSTRVFQGETVFFRGHGIDPDGSIVGYSWRSSVDGELSTAESFQTSFDTAGKNTVYFKVQDNAGEWSKELYRDITILDKGAIKPLIHSFGATPTNIIQGESTTLAWNVSGADTVSIDQEIGSVVAIGNRNVSPKKSTNYTITARNDAGTSTAEIRVVVTYSLEGQRIIDVYAIDTESGHVKGNAIVGTALQVGGTDSEAIQLFLSFDISMIPDDAVIKSASIDLTTGVAYGDPFSYLGELGIYHQQYGDLSKDDFVPVPAGNAMITTRTRPTQLLSSSQMAQAIQGEVNKGSDRFQVRLQFERPYFFNMSYDYIDFGSDNPRLVIVYE